MATITFYQKPGCRTNAHQKQMLEAAGHTVVARSLLAEPWTAERLRGFFGTTPVAAWFNPAAPRIKSGEIDPAAVDASVALAIMLEDPLLIRRPLMAALGRTECGFDEASVDAWVGLQQAEPIGEDCPRGDGKSCEAPA